MPGICFFFSPITFLSERREKDLGLWTLYVGCLEGLLFVLQILSLRGCHEILKYVALLLQLVAHFATFV